MKIPIETNEEKDQRKEEEAWRKQLDYNAKIMKACMAAIPDRPECIWVALFKSIVPSASQGDIGKLLNVGFGLLEEADKSIKSIDNRITFDDAELPEPPPVLTKEIFEGGGPAVLDEPPEPPPPAVMPGFITVGNTATLLYENQTLIPIKIRVFNDDPQLGLEIGTQAVKPCQGLLVRRSGYQDVILPASVALWGMSVSGGVKVRVRIIDSHEEKDSKEIEAAMRAGGNIPIFCDSDSIPADNPICLLCGSDDLLQTVHLSTDITGRDGVYVIPKTGQRVILKETCICMKCMRRLVEKELGNYAE